MSTKAPYRDPAAVCAAILAWAARNPGADLRVGQLLVNATDDLDLFFMEDDELAAAIDNYQRLTRGRR